MADGRREAVVAAVAVEAGVVGELFGVVAEVELVVGLEEVAGGQDEFGLAVALEAGAGDDVEDAVGAVADISGVAAALDFDVVDVLGVDLRAEVAGDVGVGDLDAVDEPADLVAAAHVEHVVGHVGAGDVVGDHRHAVGAVCAGSVGRCLARLMVVVGVTESTLAESCSPTMVTDCFTVATGSSKCRMGDVPEARE